MPGLYMATWGQSDTTPINVEDVLNTLAIDRETSAQKSLEDGKQPIQTMHR